MRSLGHEGITDESQCKTLEKSKGLLNLARGRVSYALIIFEMTGYTGQNQTNKKKLQVELKDNSSYSTVSRLWMGRFSNWHLNWTVQTKQTITAANMHIFLLAMFCAITTV